ncbi:1-acyl-sn-glycerol-3-phosphate acyltransferase [Hyunsoonleella ulvae]|uniref:1-acyl-sn-glycerol-3-phosphate acyltransferase n=1 Tax=Hyunsoonleella ulvae TaxID=2799948 RepID=UPI001939403C|nr:1-acyl-sn-glycerol-3-phosphate acyltransferase [Hyunsoonleella ulvae]
MRQWLAKFIYYKLMGWQIDGHYKILQNDLKKVVIIAAPHTSWYDFLIGILVRTIIGVKVNFLGKKELFVFPFGYLFKALGGQPVNRQKHQNKVKVIAEFFREKEVFRLALAPEGTRQKVDKWRTGFYHIAKEANVPIIMFTLDFKHKRNTFSKPFYTGNDMEKDLKLIRGFYKGVKGRIPEYS